MSKFHCPPYRLGVLDYRFHHSEYRRSLGGVLPVMAADSVVAPASRSPDTDFVPGCLIQLSTNICVPACAIIVSPISDKSHASMWRPFLRRCMRIHSFYGYQDRFSAHFWILSARLLQNRGFDVILSLETTPHGGTFVYYLFSIQFAYIYSYSPFPS